MNGRNGPHADEIGNLSLQLAANRLHVPPLKGRMPLTGGIAMCHGYNVVTGGKKASTGDGRIIAVDVAMQVMQVEGATADGRALFRKKLSRPQFARFMASQDSFVRAR